MDWIQWYYAFWLVLGIIVPCVLHGEGKKPWDARFVPLNFVLTLPVVGRIFGWW